MQEMEKIGSVHIQRQRRTQLDDFKRVRGALTAAPRPSSSSLASLSLSL